MTLLSRLFLVALALPFVVAHNTGDDHNDDSGKSCDKGNFYFKQADCCVPQGGNPSPPKPPSGTECPSNGWDWHDDKGCCVPHSPPEQQPPPSCSQGWGWHSDKLHCTPTAPPSAPSKPTSPSKPNNGNCGNGAFFWGKKDCCLPQGGPPTPPPPPPADTECPPSGWSWHPGKGCCTPHEPNPPSPQCPKGWEWDDDEDICHPSKPTPPSKPTTPPSPPSKPTQPQGPGSCDDDHFWWGPKQCCLPHGGPSKPPPPPPSDTECPPNGWSWHPSKGCCTPHHPNPPNPQCPKGWDWSDDDDKCYPIKPTPPPKPTPSHGSGDCDSGHFWWGPKQCCLPHGGPPSAPPPPSGNQCPPSGWSWYPGKGCCAPHEPPTNQPPPQCPKNWDWSNDDYMCHPTPSKPTPVPPRPSGFSGNHGNHGYHRRSSLKARAAPLCPNGQAACPIKGVSGLTGDYECLDTTQELTSCGGCASLGTGQDCTAIIGAWNVKCDVYQGGCRVLTCTAGYKISSDGKSCLQH